MNYAAVRHLAPGAGDAGALKGGDRLPWEADLDQSTARQETWLLSFIDILALLLTLFVLLLAFQDRGQVEPVPEAAKAEAVSPVFFDMLALSRAQGGLSPTATADGYAMPGEGLVPVESGPLSASAEDRTVTGEARPQAGIASAQDAQTAVPTAAISSDQPQEAGTSDPGQTEPPAVTMPSADTVVAATSADAADAEHDVVPTEVRAGTTAPTVSSSPADTQTAQTPATLQAADNLLHSLHDSALGDRVEVVTRPGAVNLEISDNILFAPASAALSTDGEALLGQLAEILKTLPYSLSVEGHTDNVPIHTERYPSNWELSSARAARVTRKLIEQGVASDRLRTVGYGDTRPRSDNATPQARAKNRRVTFVLQVEERR